MRYRDDSGRIDPFVDDETDESEWPDVDLGGFPTGFSLVKVCLRIVWKDKEILLFQVLSAALSLILLYLFLAAVFPSFDPETVSQVVDSPVFLFDLFPYYVAIFFVATFFKAATIAVATIRMKGGDPVFADGIEAAARKVHWILGWAIISAIVGVVLAALQRRGRGGRAAARVANLAWSVLTYFSIPVILFEDEGPVSAIERSAHIVKRTWKESLAGNLGMGLVFLGLGLIGLPILVIAYSVAGILVAIVAFIAYEAFVGIFNSAASGVLVAALYQLARTGIAPGEVDDYEPLSSAVASVSPSLPGDYLDSGASQTGLMMTRRI